MIKDTVTLWWHWALSSDCQAGIYGLLVAGPELLWQALLSRLFNDKVPVGLGAL